VTASTRSYSASIDLVAPGNESTIADQIAHSLMNDSFTRKVVRRRVTQLLRLVEFASDDEDDLTQEFLIRLIDAMKHHREDVGHRNPYIVSVVDRHAATLLEHRRAAVRYAEDSASINQQVSDSELGSVAIVDMLGERDAARRLQRRALNEHTYTSLKSDLAVIVDRLSEAEQRMVHLLRDHTVSEAAQVMGVPRSTLVSWLEKIAAIFDEEGLREYLL
jgi:RNA polymerase sigma-70 factor, ECF subfamily